jgi:hypothetical protein
MMRVTLRDGITGFILDVLGSQDDGRQAATVALVQLFKRHIRSLPNNKRGWPSQHYWGEAASGVYGTPTRDGCTITVPKIGFAMHATGEPGEINPVKARMLTIPATPEAYGRRAREFSNLKIAYCRRGGKLVAYALVQAGDGDQTHAIKLATGRSVGRASPGKVIFWLKESVQTAAYTPSPIPSDADCSAAIEAAMDNHLNRVAARNR